MKRTVDYGREPGYAALPIKIVCQSNRPAQVKTSRRADLYGTGHWEPASATQIARSGAAATGTPAALVADQIGGAARSNQVQCRSHRVIGLCSAEQYPGAWARCWQAGWASGDLLEMRAGAAPAPGCGLPAISLGL